MQTLQISHIKVDLSVGPVNSSFQILPELSESENAIIAAAKGVKIKDISLNEFINSINSLIKNVHIRMGYKNFDAQLIEEQQMAICRDLLTYYKTLTFEELRIVIDHALMGEYSSEVFFSPSYLMQWIKRYLERKAEANKKYIRTEQRKEFIKPNPTQEETDNILQNVLLNHFSEMSKDQNGIYEQDIIDYGGVLFDFLERKYTPLSKERKFEIYNLYSERMKNRSKDDVVKKCKSIALVEMLRIAHDKYLNSI